MFERNSPRWIDLLGQVTQAYNLRPSTALFNYSPTQAREPHNFQIVQKLQHERKKNYENKFKKHKFQLGDYVKIVIPKDPFSRGFTKNFSSQSYPITKIFSTKPPTYQVQNFDQKYYEPQLSRSTPNEPVYYVAKIDSTPSVLRSGKIKSDEKRYLVKDKTNPDYSSWKTFEEFKNFRKNNSVINDGNLENGV